MPPRVTQLAEQVANENGVQVQSLFYRTNLARIVRARQELFYRMRALNPRVFTYPKIGQIMGYNHANVLWGVRRHAELNGLEVPSK